MNFKFLGNYLRGSKKDIIFAASKHLSGLKDAAVSKRLFSCPYVKGIKKYRTTAPSWGLGNRPEVLRLDYLTARSAVFFDVENLSKNGNLHRRKTRRYSGQI